MFSIPIKYKTVTSVSGESYEIPLSLRLIDGNRLMQGTLNSHVNNLSELYDCDCSNKSNQQIKMKYDDKKIRTKCKSCSKNSK